MRHLREIEALRVQLSVLPLVILPGVCESARGLNQRHEEPALL
jgi:hypothetical protein